MPYGTINVDTVTTSTTGGILGAGNASIMKNRIINGDMRIDQYKAGTLYTPTGGAIAYGAIDRWSYAASQASKFTVQQNSSSVTPPVGFTYYMGIVSSSAYTVGASEQFNILQVIEGFNIADLGWGTADAKTVTLSFWVRSSLTGTFGGVLNNTGKAYSYPFTYSIPVANTWTQISVTIAGPTAGTWNTTNGAGIYVTFGLGVGSTVSGTAGSWSANQYFGATGATSVVGTNGATFYITGVQLEVGSSATGFEYVNYQTSLANCQRYYEQNTPGVPTQRTYGAGVMPGYDIGIMLSATDMRVTGTQFKIPKRTDPSIVFIASQNSTTNSLWTFFNASAWTTSSATSLDVINIYGFGATMTVSGRTQGQAYIVDGFWTASAEL